MNAQDREALVQAFLNNGRSVKVCPTRISVGSKQLRDARSKRIVNAG